MDRRRAPPACSPRRARLRAHGDDPVPRGAATSAGTGLRRRRRRRRVGRRRLLAAGPGRSAATRTLTAIDAGRPLTAAAAGAGAIWAVSADPPSLVLRFDPATRRVTDTLPFADPRRRGRRRSPSVVAASDDGLGPQHEHRDASRASIRSTRGIAADDPDRRRPRAQRDRRRRRARVGRQRGRHAVAARSERDARPRRCGSASRCGRSAATAPRLWVDDRGAGPDPPGRCRMRSRVAAVRSRSRSRAARLRGGRARAGRRARRRGRWRPRSARPSTYGGPGKPRFLIVTQHGVPGPRPRAMACRPRRPSRWCSRSAGWRAGEYTVGLQACEETDAKTGIPSPDKCRRNARAFAENRSVLGLIGP